MLRPSREAMQHGAFLRKVKAVTHRPLSFQSMKLLAETVGNAVHLPPILLAARECARRRKSFFSTDFSGLSLSCRF